MGTKSLTITEEAYERLKAHKRADESFTDVIIRLTDRNADAERFIGKYRDVDLDVGVANVEERFDRDVRETRPNVRRQ